MPLPPPFKARLLPTIYQLPATGYDAKPPSGKLRRNQMQTVDINITAGKESVGEPWIWRLSREFNVKVLVKKANIDTDYGWMQLELEGPVEEIQRATAWLMTTGMHVEALQRAVGA